MTEKEISELYVRLAFQYESAIDTLLTKGLMSPSNPQRWRNGKRCCMPLVNQFLTGSIIKFFIHVINLHLYFD